MQKLIAVIMNWTRKRLRLVAIFLLIAVLGPVALIAGCFAAINPYHKYVIAANSNTHVDVGLVLGAGITADGRPFKELQARLDAAANALQKGTVRKLILSGDNRFDYYDEPTAMINYLVEKHGVNKSNLQADFAGRSTYESCERAAKIFGLKQTIIFSAPSHLPRAIYLCRHFGIESYGVGSNIEANNSTRREMLARVKAVYNLYIRGENTILGTPINLDLK
ncbi:MAG TPA: ElyC/SanA/YdcF family protein [Candidatus Saccharimonadales bacterium]